MLDGESVVTFCEATKRLPRMNGRKIHASTLWRWATKGVQGVQLEVLRLGGRYVTSIEALERFGEQLAHQGAAKRRDADTPHSAKRPTTRKRPRGPARKREIQRAESELSDAGI